MDTSKGVYVKEPSEQMATLIRTALEKNGVKDRDIRSYDPAKIEKDALIAVIQEKTDSTLKVSLSRVSEVVEGRPTLVAEKVIESKV
ncbi:hypothetical protein [Candidatus Nitrososphaera sp. FF02]|uniref:hypothetical protein n=1 Tax=Candidatus Nitrososphaera sp. FF02 TaxID=3398226 RepID=UPI0039E81F57